MIDLNCATLKSQKASMRVMHTAANDMYVLGELGASEVDVEATGVVDDNDDDGGGGGTGLVHADLPSEQQV